MRRLLSSLTFALFALAGAAQAQIGVKLGAPWDGKTIPPGQHCPLFGGNGATPPMAVSGLPKGTAMVVLSFNDKSYGPLSKNGGHGRIGFAVKGDSANLPAVPGMTATLPGGATLVAKSKATGKYASKGYLPPCSGGKGNRYTVDVSAIGADGKQIEAVTLDIGRY